MYLLDTCTLLWLAADQEKLSTKATNTISKNTEELFISAISAFEIAIKHRNNKLKLPVEPEKWFYDAVEFHNIHTIDIDPEIAANSALLPLIHNDPCDRMIIATAQKHKLKIITCDKNIAQYSGIKVVW